MINLIARCFKKYFVTRKENESIESEIKILKKKILELELINKELQSITAKQSELINAVASVQSDIIGVFVSAEQAVTQFHSDPAKPFVVSLPGVDDDDFLN